MTLTPCGLAYQTFGSPLGRPLTRTAGYSAAMAIIVSTETYLRPSLPS